VAKPGAESAFCDWFVDIVTVLCEGGYVSLDREMANVTAFDGQSVRVRCDVSGFPLPRYRWTLNGRPLPSNSARHDVRTTVWGSL